MNLTTKLKQTAFSYLFVILSTNAYASEGLLAKTKGAEPLSTKALDVYQSFIFRNDKGSGTYKAIDFKTEMEYGMSDRFTFSGAVIGHDITTSGLIIDGYIPEARNTSALSGIELSAKNAFLTPALDDIGLSTSFKIEYDTLDMHSGQDKDTLSATVGLQLQKYFMDGQLVWLGNANLETTHAQR